jgi:hypothetical protein
MQCNTALGFVFSGLAVWSLYFQKDWPAHVFGALVALIGTCTLLKYMLNVNLGIDYYSCRPLPQLRLHTPDGWHQYGTVFHAGGQFRLAEPD